MCKVKKIDVWPDAMDVVRVSDAPTIFHTQFSDMEKYHDTLIKRIFELEKDEDFTHRMEIGGSKVGHIHEWGTAEAELINARATAFFCQAVGREDAIIQLSWASISRKHEYLSF